MRLILSLAALFLSVILLQLSSGGVGPLDALTGLEQGFSKGQIGILGSSHFLGFFIGCWWAPRVMGSVGHSRAFAVFTSMGAIGMLGHTLLIDPMAWAVMRVASGLCVAGCYTVIEAWLQAKATNENRGRTMGVYRVVDISASLGAQMMIGALAFSIGHSLTTLLGRSGSSGCVDGLGAGLQQRPNRDLGLFAFSWLFHRLLVGSAGYGQRWAFARFCGFHLNGRDWHAGSYFTN